MGAMMEYARKKITVIVEGHPKDLDIYEQNLRYYAYQQEHNAQIESWKVEDIVSNEDS